MNVSGPGLRLFTFRGIPVELDIFALLMIGLYGFQAARSGGVIVAIGVTLGVVLSILIHEFAHALVGTRFGARVIAIRLHVLGGVTLFAQSPSSYFKEFLTSLAGPVSNFALWKLLEIASDQLVERTTGGGIDTLIDVLFYVSLANLFLGIFNALPGYPLDGGQTVYFFLMWLTRREKFAAGVVMVLSCLSAVAILYYFTNGFNPRTGLSINLIFALFIAYMIASSSINLFKQSRAVSKPALTPRQIAEQKQKEASQRVKNRPSYVLFESGKNALLSKDYAAAINFFNLALEAEPEAADYLDYRAYTFAQIGEYSQALADYNRLVTLVPTRADFYTARAEIHKNLGNYLAARADVDQALKLNSTEPMALQLKRELEQIPL